MGQGTLEEQTSMASSSRSPLSLTFSAKKRKLSSLLDKFLSTKRTADVPPPGWEPVLPSDEFLREFHNDPTFKVEAKGSSSSSVIGGEEGKRGQANGINASHIEDMADETDEEGCWTHQHASEHQIISSSSSSSISTSHTTTVAAAKGDTDNPLVIQLKLFNLPYNLTTSELKEWGKKQHVLFVKIEMDMKNEAFIGSARVRALMVNHTDYNSDDSDEEIEEGETESLAQTRRIVTHRNHLLRCLNEKPCKGRPVRLKEEGLLSLEGGKRPSLGGGSRYYERLVNIHVKCNRCGEVGHMERECDNSERAMPCHLCAGGDHEASSCPNLVCFRCRGFGHNRNACTVTNAEISRQANRRFDGGHLTGMLDSAAARGVVCSQCGSIRHNFRFCPEILLPKIYGKIGDKATHHGAASGSGSGGGGSNGDKNKTGGSKAFALSAHSSKIPVRTSPLDIHSDVKCLVCQKRGHAICGEWPGIEYPAYTAAPPQSTKESNSSKKRKFGQLEPPVRASEDVVQMIRERGNAVKIYCPHCGRKGHHCDYVGSGGERDYTCTIELQRQVNRLRTQLVRDNGGVEHFTGRYVPPPPAPPPQSVAHRVGYNPNGWDNGYARYSTGGGGDYAANQRVVQPFARQVQVVQQPRFAAGRGGGGGGQSHMNQPFSRGRGR